MRVSWRPRLDGRNFSLTKGLRSPVSGLTESMSVFVKPKLKALKECLASKDWEGVHKNAK